MCEIPKERGYRFGKKLGKYLVYGVMCVCGYTSYTVPTRVQCSRGVYLGSGVVYSAHSGAEALVGREETRETEVDHADIADVVLSLQQKVLRFQVSMCYLFFESPDEVYDDDDDKKREINERTQW